MSFSVELNRMNGASEASEQPSQRPQGSLGGRAVVVVDPSYVNRKDVKAGDYGKAFATLISTAIAAVYLFATFLASIIVGVATGSLATAGMTAGVMIGVPAAAALLWFGIGSFVPRASV